jgi:hypothetical protein
MAGYAGSHKKIHFTPEHPKCGQWLSVPTEYTLSM